MNLLLRAWPGDGAAWMAVSLLVQVTILSVLAIAIGRRRNRRNPAWRHQVYLCGLVCILAAPLTVWLADLAGLSLVQIPVRPPAEAASAVAASAEPIPYDPYPPTDSFGMSAPEGAGDWTVPPAAGDTPLDPTAPVAAAPVEAPPAAAAARTGHAVRWPDAIRAAAVVLGILWAAGALVLLGRLVAGALVCCRVQRSSAPLEPWRLAAVAPRICGHLGLRELPATLESPLVSGPLSMGILHPVVILPTGLADRLSPVQLGDVLMHECAHIVHRDTLVGLAQRIAQMLFWPHLLVHRLNRLLGRAREEVCDNHAVSASGPCDYAQTLLTVASAAGGQRRVPAVGLIQPRWGLEQRVAWLLDRSRGVTTRLSRPALLACVAAFAVLAGTLAACRVTLATGGGIEAEWERIEALLIGEVDDDGPMPEAADAVVVNLDQFWRSVHWSNMINTENCGLSFTDGVLRMETPETIRAHSWLARDLMPIDPQRYPIVVMTYRCRNIRGYGGDVLRLQDHRSWRKAFGLFTQDELIADGEPHEIRADIRELEIEGGIVELLIRIRSGEEAPAFFEFLDLRFEADPYEPANTVAAGEPVAITVVDDQGYPVAGADVTIDAGRLNWAQSARTDSDGRVMFTPPDNGAGRHVVRVAKAGMVTVEKRIEGDDMITLVEGVRYGGVVVDEQGRPVVAASVGSVPGIYFDGPMEHRYVFSVLTDEQGRWQSPVLPKSLEHFPVRVSHRDYLFERAYQAPMEALRNGAAEIILTRGARITGVVVDDEGHPVEDARVRQGVDRWGHSPYPQVRTDSEGRFEFYQGMRGKTVITFTKNGSGLAPELIVLEGEDLQPANMPLRIEMTPGSVIRGRVVDSAGDPISQVVVLGHDWRGYQTIDAYAVTDADGRFEIRDMPADRIGFSIELYPYKTTGTYMSPGEGTYTIRLLREGETFIVPGF